MKVSESALAKLCRNNHSLIPNKLLLRFASKHCSSHKIRMFSNFFKNYWAPILITEQRGEVRSFYNTQAMSANG